jgi:hypothetical protein
MSVAPTTAAQRIASCRINALVEQLAAGGRLAAWQLDRLIPDSVTDRHAAADRLAAMIAGEAAARLANAAAPSRRSSQDHAIPAEDANTALLKAAADRRRPLAARKSTRRPRTTPRSAL